MAKAVETKATAETAKIPSKGAKKRFAIIKSAAMGAAFKFDPEKQLKSARSLKARALSQALSVHADPSVLDRLWSILELRRTADPVVSHLARLLGRGTTKVAQKFGEEAVECLIEIVAANRTAALAESADVLPSAGDVDGGGHTT